MKMSTHNWGFIAVNLKNWSGPAANPNLPGDFLLVRLVPQERLDFRGHLAQQGARVTPLELGQGEPAHLLALQPLGLAEPVVAGVDKVHELDTIALPPRGAEGEGLETLQVGFDAELLLELPGKGLLRDLVVGDLPSGYLPPFALRVARGPGNENLLPLGVHEDGGHEELVGGRRRRRGGLPVVVSGQFVHELGPVELVRAPPPLRVVVGLVVDVHPVVPLLEHLVPLPDSSLVREPRRDVVVVGGAVLHVGGPRTEHVKHEVLLELDAVHRVARPPQSPGRVHRPPRLRRHPHDVPGLHAEHLPVQLHQAPTLDADVDLLLEVVAVREGVPLPGSEVHNGESDAVQLEGLLQGDQAIRQGAQVREALGVRRLLSPAAAAAASAAAVAAAVGAGRRDRRGRGRVLPSHPPAAALPVATVSRRLLRPRRGPAARARDRPS
mmetsp:Transcript_5875/g.17693  ORF Transcript_5875/g.17693 Transcript_5875/m.17693 type:complete len:439 (-) Transcript_5875:287-1603(-)